MKVKRNINKGEVSLWILITLVQVTISEAKTNAACESPCDCKARLKKISYYDIRIANARKKFEDNLKQLLKLEIATLSGDKALAKAAVPVIGAAGSILDQCKAKLDDAQNKFDTVGRLAAKVGKTYSIMQHFVKTTSQLKLTAAASGHFKEGAVTQKSLGTVKPSKCDGPGATEKRDDDNGRNGTHGAGSATICTRNKNVAKMLHKQWRQHMPQHGSRKQRMDTAGHETHSQRCLRHNSSVDDQHTYHERGFWEPHRAS
uniref:Variant surface glycoprotein 1892 n=1 Tax=Trypanosoma brucei TaxID=5691 RepID=M4SWL6_9TRYP|nr:variant surface glycoprotein 1892 [Trypanosoma brucei]